MTDPQRDLDEAHSRYPHVYAVVRWDDGLGEPEDHVSITKVFWSKTRADAEAHRLRELNSSKGCRYFVVLTRLVPQ